MSNMLETKPQGGIKKIGIVGSGNMGRVIGLNWAEKDHQVFFGHRRPEVLEQIKELAGNIPIQTGSNEEAVRASDIILYTIRDAMPSEIAEKSAWAGKIIIDIKNSFSKESLDNTVTSSYAERYQEDVPEAHVVKALNCHAQETFELETEQIRNSGAISFFCGNDKEANKTMAELINDIGLTAVESGSLEQAKWIEGVAKVMFPLWMQRGIFISLSLTDLPQPSKPKFGGRQTNQV